MTWKENEKWNKTQRPPWRCKGCQRSNAYSSQWCTGCGNKWPGSGSNASGSQTIRPSKSEEADKKLRDQVSSIGSYKSVAPTSSGQADAAARAAKALDEPEHTLLDKNEAVVDLIKRNASKLPKELQKELEAIETQDAGTAPKQLRSPTTAWDRAKEKIKKLEAKRTKSMEQWKEFKLMIEKKLEIERDRFLNELGGIDAELHDARQVEREAKKDLRRLLKGIVDETSDSEIEQDYEQNWDEDEVQRRLEKQEAKQARRLARKEEKRRGKEAAASSGAGQQQPVDGGNISDESFLEERERARKVTVGKAEVISLDNSSQASTRPYRSTSPSKRMATTPQRPPPRSALSPSRSGFRQRAAARDKAD